MAFTDRIKEARKRKGFTQEQIAGKIGVAKSTYTGYEKGNSEPNMITMQKLMSCLDVDANFLLQDEIKFRQENRATPEEMEKLVKKYRLLDTFGQEAVDRIIDVELKRCIYKSNQGRGAEEIAREPQVLYLPEPLQKASAGRGALADDDSAGQRQSRLSGHPLG